MSVHCIYTWESKRGNRGRSFMIVRIHITHTYTSQQQHTDKKPDQATTENGNGVLVVLRKQNPTSQMTSALSEQTRAQIFIFILIVSLCRSLLSMNISGFIIYSFLQVSQTKLTLFNFTGNYNFSFIIYTHNIIIIIMLVITTH